MKTYWVYILLCSDDTYYTGVTSDLNQRIEQHNSALHPESYTASRLPVKLVWSNAFKYVDDAIAWEKRIKKWSQLKKQALIKGDFGQLSVLSKKTFG